MDWTSLIGPAVVAAVIGGTVAVVGFLVNRATVRGMHGERLAFDKKQAKLRATAEIDIIERKVNADIALAERRVALDRALAAWKRRTELAEEVLADFYQARDVIQAARSPGSYGNEGNTRPKISWETEQDAGALNAFYATTERLTAKADFFAQVHARRYIFLALFGSEAASHFDTIFRLRHEINVAVYMLISTQRSIRAGNDVPARREWENKIWDTQDANDPITARLNQCIEGIEAICRPILQETAP